MVIGRVANRIGGSAFEIDGERFEVTANEGPNCLHGGPAGFDKRLWRFAEISDERLTLVYGSPDGEEGFPGDLDAEGGQGQHRPGALDHRTARVDQVDGPAVRAAQRPAGDPVTPLGGVGGRSDHRDRPRVGEHRQRRRHQAVDLGRDLEMIRRWMSDVPSSISSSLASRSHFSTRNSRE